MAKALLESTFRIPAAAVRDLEGLRRVDARSRKLRFEIRTLESGVYRTLPPDADGWAFSPLLGLRLRLTREEVRPGRWSYRLEHREP